MGLRPTQQVVKVNSASTVTLAAEQVSVETVGTKAFGLASLPSAWTLPFVVVSSDLQAAYRKTDEATRRDVVHSWVTRIREAALATGIFEDSALLIRSSATTESLEDRGRYYSTAGTLASLGDTLSSCLSQLIEDVDLELATVHLIVQRQVSPVSGKGHLSNERMCYEEARDWLGQFEGTSPQDNETFTVNLRNWREKESSDSESRALACNLKALVSRVLYIPAWWGYRQKLRLHFEWVWDGARIFLVQADVAEAGLGLDPTKDPNFNEPPTSGYKPRYLVPINEDHARRFNKIRNVYASYLTLGLPSIPLFVLDDPDAMADLRAQRPSHGLRADLNALAQRSLVIRTDLATEDKLKRQLLPRTNEVRDGNAAILFMQETLANLQKSGVLESVAFIFHNFIPAVASAFAYAASGQRKVWIEALWGLPEGLYYNAHDKIEVDTLNADPARLLAENLARFGITKRPNFKRNFVAPDSNGDWIVKKIAEPWDWRLSIQKDEWIAQIAYDSRRIAELEKRSVSIMWFVGVPNWASSQPVLPWYHEAFDLAHVDRLRASRSKTPFDKSLVIRTRGDLDALKVETLVQRSRVRQIRIQPTEDALLRDKGLLKDIGELAKKIDAVILLEGGTLSHAYYQLVQTEAVVEVAHPFHSKEEKREFNKLVRDGIPRKIASGGEDVRVSRLTGDLLLRALREKLVEEAYEALAAKDHDSILEELADIEEVVDAVLRQLKSRRRDLLQKQRAKATKAGGLEEGYILFDTSSPPPSKPIEAGPTLFGQTDAESRNGHIAEQPPTGGSVPILAKWVDRREHQSARERLLTIIVSLVHDAWAAESTEIPIGSDASNVIRARVQGKRTGATLQLEISVYIPPKQLDLLK